MKKLLFIVILMLGACGEKQITVQAEEVEEPVKQPKYKKGDVVCVMEFNMKGIIQFKNINFASDDDFVYTIMFMNNLNEFYNMNIYETQLTECH